MAIVFISPKEKQKTFIMIIAVSFILGLTGIGFLVFLSSPKPVQNQQVFVHQDIKPNYAVLDSDDIKNLQPLPDMNKEFKYIGTTLISNQAQVGTVEALTQDVAKQQLTSQGLNPTTLRVNELVPGRDNPFASFYEVIVPKTVAKPATKAPAKK